MPPQSEPQQVLSRHMPLRQSVSSVQALNIPEVEKQRIFGTTALSILNNV